MEGVGAKPVDLILAQRLAMMQEPELAAFWEKMLSSGQMIENLLQTIEKIDKAGGKKAPSVDPRYSTEEDIVVSVLAEILKMKRLCYLS